MALQRNPRYWVSGQSTEARVLYQRNPRFTRDMLDGGDGQFSNPLNDPITLESVPYRAKLRVFEEKSGRLIRETWSAEDGTWLVPYLNRNQTYLVVCYDATYPALAYDHQTPDPMT